MITLLYIRYKKLCISTMHLKVGSEQSWGFIKLDIIQFWFFRQCDCVVIKHKINLLTACMVFSHFHNLFNNSCNVHDHSIINAIFTRPRCMWVASHTHQLLVTTMMFPVTICQSGRIMLYCPVSQIKTQKSVQIIIIAMLVTWCILHPKFSTSIA